MGGLIMLEKIQMRMYATHKCACGCGKPLGTWTVRYSDDDICIGVGDSDDDNGDYYRMFRPSCWSRLKLDDIPLDKIYSYFPGSPINE